MNLSTSLTASLRAASAGLALAVLTILYGQGMGIVFGLNEDVIKSRLKASAAEVRDSVYKGNDATSKAVLDKSWSYMQRAHLHAGGMGTTAVSLIVVLCLLGTSRLATTAISVALGAGGFGYSVFWMWAGFRASCAGEHGGREGIAQVARHAVLRCFCPGHWCRARRAPHYRRPAAAFQPGKQ